MQAYRHDGGQGPDGSVTAVVVTYHPDALVAANLQALVPEVDRVVVIDNGSTAAELLPLRALPGVEIHENGANLGIATALNQGVRLALVGGAAWVLLFDQDSRVEPGFTAAMLHAFRESPWGARLAILVPRYVDSRLGTALPQDRAAEGLEAVMTSGSLLRAETFAEFGLFADELFIDGVDYEYSLRLRRAGRVLDECLEAVLLHSPGDPVVTRFRGRKLFQTANYSPVRRYYQERNKVWIMRRYWRSFPEFGWKLARYSIKDFGKLLLVEPNGWTKLRFFVRGLWHGLRSRMGPMPK